MVYYMELNEVREEPSGSWRTQPAQKHKSSVVFDRMAKIPGLEHSKPRGEEAE